MTREFNKQRRDDSRPSFRNRPSSRFEAEQPSRPARPRLNREIVDRAWENGASHQHADYRPHSNGHLPRNNNGYPPRNNQRSEYSSSQHGYSGNRSYDNNGNRTQNQRDQRRTTGHRFERSSNEQRGSYARPFDSERHNFNNHNNHQQFNDQRGPSGEQGATGYRQKPYSPSRNGHGPQSREPRRGQQHYSQRGDESPYGQQRRPAPHARSSNYSRQRYDDAPRGERTRSSQLFKGDYEHFTDADIPQRSRRSTRETTPDHYNQTRTNQRFQPRDQEPHVTRLPDGRVLKGPRPVQRKNAQFWTDVTEDTKALVQHVQTPAETEKTNLAPGRQAKNVPTGKTRKRAAVARDKKQANAKPRSTGPKPSQRGFKWPTP